MMYVYIFLLAPSSVIVTVHVTYGEAMPNFHYESKVTCCQTTPIQKPNLEAPMHAKPRKPMPKYVFLLPISKN